MADAPVEGDPPPDEPQGLGRQDDPTKVDLELNQLVQSARIGSLPSDLQERANLAAVELFELEVKKVEIASKQAEDDRELRAEIADKVIKAVSIQVILADLVFLVYALVKGFAVPTAAINAWLGATVVQVIAVALVIARSLFPSK